MNTTSLYSPLPPLRLLVLSQDSSRQQQFIEVLLASGLQQVFSASLTDCQQQNMATGLADVVLVDLPSLGEDADQTLITALDQCLETLAIPVFFDETPQQINAVWAQKLVEKLAAVFKTAQVDPPLHPTKLLRLAIATRAEQEITRLTHILDILGLKTTVHTHLDEELLAALVQNPADALLVDLRTLSEQDPHLAHLETFINQLTDNITLPVFFADTPASNAHHLETWAIKLAAKLTHTSTQQLAERLESSAEHVAFSPLVKPPVALAVAFADICGSTHLYESLGDYAAQQLIANCIHFLTDITHQHKGIVIKTIGDEIMCTFPTADLAIAAALSMQSNLNQATRSKTSLRAQPGHAYAILGIRVGIHFGPVVQASNDVFGDTVNVAARMASLAKSAQIITTGQTIEALSPLSGMHYRQIDRSYIRGKREEFDIFEVLSVAEYQSEATVRAVHKIIHKRQAHLALRYHQQEILMSPAHPKVTLGRNEKNDICIDDALISRFHARIEFYRGQFILHDQSFNGTFIVTYSGEDVFLHRDYMPLKNKGIIALGCTIGNNKHIIFYQCEPA